MPWALTERELQQLLRRVAETWDGRPEELTDLCRRLWSEFHAELLRENGR